MSARYLRRELSANTPRESTQGNGNSRLPELSRNPRARENLDRATNTAARARRSPSNSDYRSDASKAFVYNNRNIATSTLRNIELLSTSSTPIASTAAASISTNLRSPIWIGLTPHGKIGIRAKAKKLRMVKAFIIFCVKREWLAKDIVDDPAGTRGLIGHGAQVAIHR